MAREDDLKLSSDETMRHLRRIAQSPGELEWRMELLAAIDRMRTSNDLAFRSILANQRTTQKTLSSLTPIELAKAINREIEQYERTKDSAKYRSGWKTVRSHLITATIAIIVGVVLYKLTGK